MNNQNFINVQDLVEKDFFDLTELENLSDEQKQEIMQKLLVGVENRVLIRIDDLLQGLSNEQFKNLLRQGNEHEISKFLEDKGINVKQLVVEESIMQKKQIVEAIRQIRNQ